ncbi:MAG TPA: hypothetical protein VJ574_03090 [Candidatus Bathyarchaeia archaeon]|nr:hypothetical protein [Candidatus Bathyarchaeia archaeon]
MEPSLLKVVCSGDPPLIVLGKDFDSVAFNPDFEALLELSLGARASSDSYIELREAA